MRVANLFGEGVAHFFYHVVDFCRSNQQVDKGSKVIQILVKNFLCLLMSSVN